jgi:hypothetical protein
MMEEVVMAVDQLGWSTYCWLALGRRLGDIYGSRLGGRLTDSVLFLSFLSLLLPFFLSLSLSPPSLFPLSPSARRRRDFFWEVTRELILQTW